MDCSRAGTRDPEEWLENAPDFSRPLVTDLRDWIFRTAPDLTESIKWNMLCFSGRRLVCGLSACQRHVGFTFFRGTELSDPHGLFTAGETNTHIRNVRMTDPAKINRPALARLLLAAVELDLSADPIPPRKTKRAPWPMPDCLAQALGEVRHRKSAEGFAKLSPSSQREYLVWISTAKRDETRERRLKETLAALAAGRKWMDRKLA